MRRVVIDAATFIGWFIGDGEAASLRPEYEAGQLGVLVPTTFVPDVLGEVAALGWPRDRIERLSALLDEIGFEVREPSRAGLARWVGGRITPAQAAYAALAEESEHPLVAGDPELRRRAATLVQS
ncbi:MAG TPA: hypothetical protein VIH24_09725 [Candidatus Limnocylindria bacterium]|jgi:predicted nucleic acid-binding protein